MTKRALSAQLAAGAFFLVLVMLMESFTEVDMDLQRLWFDSDTHEWIVSNALHERLTWVFYDGPKTLLIALGMFCIGGFFIGKCMEVKRLLWGVLLGLFYAVLLLVLSLIVRGNAQGIIQSGLLNTLICLGGGAIGAFLS